MHASNDNLLLKPDAANLAPYIARIKSEAPDAYQRIISTIRLAAPFFRRFRRARPAAADGRTGMDGAQRPRHAVIAPHVLSDGTLRFICLTTLLLQPDNLLPDTILIDRNRSWVLHPYAINLLAEMLQQVAATKQVIVSTQSVELLDNFAPEDVIVVDRCDGASTFRRLDREDLADWLEDYSMGELWKRNILGGRPTFESVGRVSDAANVAMTTIFVVCEGQTRRNIHQYSRCPRRSIRSASIWSRNLSKPRSDTRAARWFMIESSSIYATTCDAPVSPS